MSAENGYERVVVVANEILCVLLQRASCCSSSDN